MHEALFTWYHAEVGVADAAAEAQSSAQSGDVGLVSVAHVVKRQYENNH
jgi:hypothetical protein